MLLTVRQAEAMAGIKPGGLAKSRMVGMRRGRKYGPNPVVVGGRVMYAAEELERWLAERNARLLKQGRAVPVPYLYVAPGTKPSRSRRPVADKYGVGVYAGLPTKSKVKIARVCFDTQNGPRIGSNRQGPPKYAAAVDATVNDDPLKALLLAEAKRMFPVDSILSLCCPPKAMPHVTAWMRGEKYDHRRLYWGLSAIRKRIREWFDEDDLYRMLKV